MLRYATDFLPSWAGAISIDLMPAVLVVILSIVQIAIRNTEDPDIPENRMTASDMMVALKLYERMRGQVEDGAREQAPDTSTGPATAPAREKPAAPPRSEPGNITALTTKSGGADKT